MSERKSNEDDRPIVVIGAGLSGCCIALLLSQLFKTTKIVVIEGRDDYRKELQRITQSTLESSAFGQFDNAATRSINLALSHRGICALKECNVYEDIVNDNLLILMKGRYVHLDIDKFSEQLYGQDHQGIYSISRLTLNCLFLDKLAKCKNVELKFNCKVKKIHKSGTVVFHSKYSKTNQNGHDPHLHQDPLVDNAIDALFVLGCDGAYSSVRASLQRLGRYNFNMTYIEHGYKELTIFPNQRNEFKILPNYLHIWPKHEFMLIGLPNPDKTFTCTLFAPWSMLESLTNEAVIESFFKSNFPDFIGLCPNYIEQCLKNPSSPLAHIDLSKWNYKNKILLLGDAAHAIVPFYGQGMNAGLEDCLILYRMLKENGLNDGNVQQNMDVVGNVFDEFSRHRQPSTAALSKLSLQNYVEMRSLTAKQWFVYKKKFEKALNYYAPTVWRPIYSMVAFSTTPYNEAIERAEKQDRYLSVALTSTAILSVASLAMLASRYNAVGMVKAKWTEWSESYSSASKL
eukprot:CAMPEP_0197034078 /NCGR_PEP_ID=MMETSP1384-20130603/12282_1 /TAXON_ID=29189 /ORGANISM="Ammonia sp." /LENGTH=514 /DNA_ID=CAMNT_0042463957 /DNA_START=10 /DNA_END=1554 /DNA_ORIENTATION=-